jgi:hypothetical protein
LATFLQPTVAGNLVAGETCPCTLLILQVGFKAPQDLVAGLQLPNAETPVAFSLVYVINPISLTATFTSHVVNFRQQSRRAPSLIREIELGALVLFGC